VISGLPPLLPVTWIFLAAPPVGVSCLSGGLASAKIGDSPLTWKRVSPLGMDSGKVVSFCMKTKRQSPNRPFSGWRGRFGLLLLTLTFPLLSACSGSDGTTDPVDPVGPGTMTALEGMGARGPAGTVVPVGPTVQILDGEGDPVVGANVLLEVVEGGGSLASFILRTDSRGRASGIWILGREAGTTQRLRVTSGQLSVEFTAEAITADASETYQGRSGFVDYHPGTLPLVITAPHGGSLEPVEIPNRGWGTTGGDRNTKDLALAIREAVFARTGAYPHVIISNLHRRKLDPNREIVEAAQGNAYAERAWWEFQIFADEAGELVEDAFGEGLHLDIHGHGHAIDRLELGYLLSRTNLAEQDEVLSSAALVNKSSVRALAERAGNDLASLVRGPSSLGTLLEERFVPAVPSTDQPNPGQDDYFNGGYNTVRHGSRDGGNVSGIQIEHHYPGLRDTAENRERYAEALADALLAYFTAQFGMELAPPPG
jgi:hypothetical protein